MTGGSRGIGERWWNGWLVTGRRWFGYRADEDAAKEVVAAVTRQADGATPSARTWLDQVPPPSCGTPPRQSLRP